MGPAQRGKRMTQKAASCQPKWLLLPLLPEQVWVAPGASPLTVRVIKPHKHLAVLWEAEFFQAPSQMLVFFSISFIVWKTSTYNHFYYVMYGSISIFSCYTREDYKIVF